MRQLILISTYECYLEEPRYKTSPFSTKKKNLKPFQSAPVNRKL